MLRKGFIEQQIEGLGLVLNHLLKGKNLDRSEQLREIGASCKELTGLEMDTLLSVSEATLLPLFAGGDRTRRAGNAFVSSLLLIERARVDPASARRALRKALLLLSEALILEPSLRSPEYIATYDRLRGGLPDADKPALIRRQIALADEALGRYASAENEWYALRDAGESGAEGDALAFYERLLQREDAELEAGGLTREEIAESLAELPAQ